MIRHRSAGDIQNHHRWIRRLQKKLARHFTHSPIKQNDQIRESCKFLPLGYSARSRHTLGDRRLAARTQTDGCDSEITDTHITFVVLAAVTLCHWESSSLLVDTTHWLHLHVRFIEWKPLRNVGELLARRQAVPRQETRIYDVTWLDGFQLWCKGARGNKHS